MYFLFLGKWNIFPIERASRQIDLTSAGGDWWIEWTNWFDADLPQSVIIITGMHTGNNHTANTRWNDWDWKSEELPNWKGMTNRTIESFATSLEWNNLKSVSVSVANLTWKKAEYIYIFFILETCMVGWIRGHVEWTVEKASLKRDEAKLGEKVKSRVAVFWITGLVKVQEFPWLKVGSYKD